MSILKFDTLGIIDAAVNGGINKYGEAFLTKEAEEDYPAEMKEKLKVALRKQLEVVEYGLRLHSRLCKAGMKGLQDKLEDFFAKMKTKVLEF